MKNELFVVQPSLKQHYGRTTTKELEFDEWTNPPEGITRKVHQIFKDGVLTSYITDENEVMGIKIKEESTITEEIPEGTILIWDEISGYIIPQYKFYTLEDLKGEIENIENIYKGE